MISLNDMRWQNLKGGYGTPFDPRPLLKNLNSGMDASAVWHDLWEGLHHQGDVGEASYAAVPEIVRIFRKRRANSWNTYAIVSIIELARDRRGNPKVPSWLKRDYFRAIKNLAEVVSTQVLKNNDVEETRAMLAVLAISAGARVHARFLINYSAEELLSIEKNAL
jgi:hypothetical protein